ncbi:MAG: dihydrofolate reductase [Frankiales bacterium]|nr:dihydrofolate reductase [Frankiales bacterium]
MRITVHAFLTLDGVVQGPGAPDEDPSGGFTAGGWLVPYADDDMGEIVDGWFHGTDALLYGRTTYQIMAAFWPQVTDPDNLVARVLNEGTKYVVTSTLADADWGPTTILRSLDDVRRLREQDGGELQVHGSAGLAASLHAAGLVDEYRLITFPVTVGAGKRLFPVDAPPRGFELLATRTTSTGAVYTALRPTAYAGAGSFGVVDGRETIDRG